MTGSSLIGRAGRRAAYTLIELLLVVSILVLVLAAAMPAFTSLMYSSDQSLAENAVRGGLLSARDVAVRSARGQDSAAVFFLEKGKISILPCTLAGRLEDVDENGDPIKRDLFVPVAGFESTQLPRDWMARGFAPPNSLGGQWYESFASSAGSLVQQGNWILPETALYASNLSNKGNHRQTFMVRFEGGSGQVKVGDTDLAVVLAATPSNEYRTGGLFAKAGVNPLQEADPVRFARRILQAPSTGTGLVLTDNDRRLLLGNESSDMVLARPVTQLAVCNERRILGAIGVDADPVTRTLYSGTDITNGPKVLSTVGQTELDKLNMWLQGTLMNGSNPVQSDARLFMVDQLAGTIKEISQ